mgnify:CR=1 FL=1
MNENKSKALAAALGQIEKQFGKNLQLADISCLYWTNFYFAFFLKLLC